MTDPAWTYDVLRSVAHPVARFGPRTNIEQLTSNASRGP